MNSRDTPSKGPRHRSVADSSSTPPPLSSSPPTPGPHPIRLPSRADIAQCLPPPTNPHLRRTSSAMSFSHRSSPSPKPIARRTSRSSLRSQQPEEADTLPTPKRSISTLIANLREAQQSTMELIEEPVALTAAQVATEHFARELATHENEETWADTVVILHDACYGHRYSRLKTNKTNLSMIVERPERIQAAVLGAAAAYVRLGGQHAGGPNTPHPNRKPAGPPPFRIRRTARSLDITSSYVTNVHGTAWMSELQTMCHSATDKLATGALEVSRAWSSSEPEKRSLHSGDLYLAPESLDAFQGALGGVADAVDAVFLPSSSTKRAFVAVRPPGHHCSADYPSGFCWLNNVHVGIEYAARTYGLSHAAILDFDLHHGDGSQAIAWQRNSNNNQKRLNAKPNSKLKLGPEIGYYSLHDINSYPCEYGDDEKVQAASLCIDTAHSQSIWNVHLEPWKTEEDFWALYSSRYCVLLEKARLFLRRHTTRLTSEGKGQPRAAVFISAGFDASEWEGEGMQRHKVNVPTDFYARLTRDIVNMTAEEDLGCEGRVISVLEGGYNDRALCSGVLSHLSGLCASPIDSVKHDSSDSIDSLMEGLNLTATKPLVYDTDWWAAGNLTALENKISPPAPPAPGGRKVRTGPQPTYATPTESFAYKVIDPNKFARSISGTMKERELQVSTRLPEFTAPPPEVDWVVATQELSKLLVPTDRQTRSCTAEELGGGKAKKEPYPTFPLSLTEVDNLQPRQLRDRKGIKLPAAYVDSVQSSDGASVRSVSRSSNRRQTMHDVLTKPPTRHTMTNRRLSTGSAVSALDEVGEGATAPPVPVIPTVMRPPPATAAGGLQAKKARVTRKVLPPLGGAPGSPARPINASSRRVSAESAHKAVDGTLKSNAMRQIAATPGPPPRTDASSMQQSLPESGSTQANMVHAVRTATTPSDSTAVPPASPRIQSSSILPAPPTSATNDLDALTSKMKKITLKVGTREEHEKKLKEREAAERRARALKGAETRRVNAAARKAAVGGAASRSEVAPLPRKAAVVTGATSATPAAVTNNVQSERVVQAQPSASLAEDGDPDQAVKDDNEALPAVTDLLPVAHAAGVRTATGFNNTKATSSLNGQSPETLWTGERFPSSVFEGAPRESLHHSELAHNSAEPKAGEVFGHPAHLPCSTLPVWSSTGVIPFAPVSNATSLVANGSPETQPKAPLKHQLSGTLQWENGVSRTVLDGAGGSSKQPTQGLTEWERKAES